MISSYSQTAPSRSIFMLDAVSGLEIPLRLIFASNDRV